MLLMGMTQVLPDEDRRYWKNNKAFEYLDDLFESVSARSDVAAYLTLNRLETSCEACGLRTNFRV